MKQKLITLAILMTVVLLSIRLISWITGVDHNEVATFFGLGLIVALYVTVITDGR